MEMIEDVEARPERTKERVSHFFEIENQTLTYTKCPGICNRDTPRKDLLRAVVAKKTIHSCGKKSDINLIAGDGRLQPEKRDFVSALGGASVMSIIL